MTVLDPARSAVLVMDFQNYGVDPNGYWGSVDPEWVARLAASGVIENTARVVAAARRAGQPVIHVGAAWRKGSPEMNMSIPVFAAGPDRSVEGTWGAEFIPALSPADGDIVIYKRSVSALAGTELDRLLRVMDVNTLALAGIVTNFAVEGTAREAVDLGYRAVVLADCCTAHSDEEHQYSLNVILSRLCTVASADEFIGWLGGG